MKTVIAVLAAGLLFACGAREKPDFSSLKITPEAWKQSGKFFALEKSGGQTAARRLFYVERGAGKDVVVFLHGFPTSSYDWRFVWPRLEKGRRLIAPDFLGFGYSSKPDDITYSIHKQVDHIEQLLLSLNIQSARFVVHDYGVSVGQELLARQREARQRVRIKSMVFLNGGVFPDEHRPRFIQTLLLGPLGSTINAFAGYATFRDNLRKILARNDRISDAELRAHWYLLNYPDRTRIVHKLMHYIPDRKAHQKRWVAALLNPPAPVRMINGNFDPISGGHVSRRYRKEVPQADIVDLKNVGHYPQLEAPESVARAILSWRAGGYR